jgi:hypothetical protein
MLLQEAAKLCYEWCSSLWPGMSDYPRVATAWPDTLNMFELELLQYPPCPKSFQARKDRDNFYKVILQGLAAGLLKSETIQRGTVTRVKKVPGQSFVRSNGKTFTLYREEKTEIQLPPILMFRSDAVSTWLKDIKESPSEFISAWIEATSKENGGDIPKPSKVSKPKTKKLPSYEERGKLSGEKRKEKWGKLRDFALGLYEEKESNWKSANHAAKVLKDKVIEHGKIIGVRLTEANAQRTVAQWFRKQKKEQTD